MSPIPIRKNSEEIPMLNQELSTNVIAQDFYNIFPFVEHLFKNTAGKEEKQKLKEVWIHSSSLGDNMIQIGNSIDKSVVEGLKSKGLLSGSGERFRLTEKGSKILRDAILNDEKSSLTKKASKKMVSNNSYDFGDYVFVKVQNPEKFGAKYVNISKHIFAKKNICPTVINDYKISTRKENGDLKNLSDYTDKELIHALHLAKKIMDNSHKIIISGSEITSVPIHNIKEFAIKILKELNGRK